MHKRLLTAAIMVGLLLGAAYAVTFRTPVYVPDGEYVILDQAEPVVVQGPTKAVPSEANYLPDGWYIVIDAQTQDVLASPFEVTNGAYLIPSVETTYDP